MKKLLKIVLIAVCSIIMLLASVFAILECRLVFSLDWTIYQSPASGLIRYALRLILALSAFAVSLLEVLNLKKNNTELAGFVFFTEVGLLLASIPVCIFGANYIGLAYTVFAVLLIALGTLQKFLQFYKKA